MISLLDHFFKNYLPPGIRKLYLFSDNCVAQNKSNAMIQFLHTVVASGRVGEIIHHFPEPGHSFLPCDRRFGPIEKLKRRTEMMYLPSDYHKIIRAACPSNEVIEVDWQWFHNYEEVLSDFYKAPRQYKASSSNEKWAVSTYRLFHYKQGSGVSVSKDHDLAHCVEFKIEKQPFDSSILTNLNKLYQGPLPISKQKYDDLQKLLPYVPAEFLGYYKDLAWKVVPPRNTQGQANQSKNNQRTIKSNI